MKPKVIFFSFLLGSLILFAAPAFCQGGNTFIKGLAPDWNQPLDYPDAFDPNNGPVAGDPFWNAWCTPTAAAMMIGHWEDMLNRNGLADGSADDNQFAIPPGYLGPNFGAGPAWHDYTADGAAGGGMGGNAQRGARPINDLGWYMDTNGTGVNAFPHAGTFLKDTAAGLNSFFAAVGTGGGQPAQNLNAKSDGVNAAYGGFTVQQLAGFVKTEIDNNRTAIAHFAHWNLILQNPANPGNGTEDSEDDFEVESYTFDSQNPGSGGHGEPWNNDTGDDALGHSVLVVGYTTNAQNQVTHLIVHDNWPSTARNVKVPVGVQLYAITRVRGFALVATKPLFPYDRAHFWVYDGTSNAPAWLVYSLYGPGYRFVPPLNVVIDLDNPDLLAPPKKTNADGYVSWSITVPPGASGLMVWFQAIQYAQKTNIVEDFVM